MSCVNCSLDTLINYIISKYKINKNTAIAVYYKLRNQVKNKLFCETDECNRRILKEYISKNRLYKFFNNLTNCQLDLIIDNVLESCDVEIPDPEPKLPGLRLTYIGGEFPANTLNDWNTFFDLPANGTAFTDMVVDGNEVTLIGGSGIALKTSLFRNDAKLLKIEDDVDCVIEIKGGKNAGALSLCPNLTTVTLNKVETIGTEGLSTNAALTSLSMTTLTTAGEKCFQNCTALVTVSLPALTSAGGTCFAGCTNVTTFSLPVLSTAGHYCFSTCTNVTTFTLPTLTAVGGDCFADCTSATTFMLGNVTTTSVAAFKGCVAAKAFDLTSCTNLGSSPDDNSVFANITGNTVTITVPTALSTCNAGNPDGDLIYLAFNNTATINYI